MNPRMRFLALSACAALASCQMSQKPHAACADMPPYKGSAAYERMKTLVGKWSGKNGKSISCGHPVIFKRQGTRSRYAMPAGQTLIAAAVRSCRLPDQP